MIQRDQILVVVAFNCNHDHTKFSLLIPINLQFKNLDRANVTENMTRYMTSHLEKFIAQKKLYPQSQMEDLL